MNFAGNYDDDEDEDRISFQPPGTGRKLRRTSEKQVQFEPSRRSRLKLTENDEDMSQQRRLRPQEASRYSFKEK